MGFTEGCICQRLFPLLLLATHGKIVFSFNLSSSRREFAPLESFCARLLYCVLSSSFFFFFAASSSKKELYFSLCHNPILIDEGKKQRCISNCDIQHSFSLDKQSGKKCYMISARDLLIIWGDTPTYWSWTSIPEARFPEVAELICVCWLEIRGKISTRSLSQGTLYTAYLVYKLTAGSFGFEYQPVVVSVGLVSGESQTRTVYLEEERGLRQGHHGLLNRSSSQASTPKENDGYFPKERKDEWLEIELGDFFNKEDEDGELEMSVLELACGHWKCGLVIQGIEIRPKLVRVCLGLIVISLGCVLSRVVGTVAVEQATTDDFCVGTPIAITTCLRPPSLEYFFAASSHNLFFNVPKISNDIAPMHEIKNPIMWSNFNKCLDYNNIERNLYVSTSFEPIILV
ncbi:hypothetical protein CUMW_243060 [Citrus unshiu]|uniref:Uncharacterized protein n=1 Tax=Citrus unshiu TaxID=55188 RepID=A0A2H5QM41_CITUN|nr:hypothetical protein CUMW_243060 [Citrus unshiu]